MNSEPNIYRRQKIYVLAGLALFALFSSLFSILVPLTGPAATIEFFVSSICWGFGIFLWCRIDSMERDDELSGGEKVAIVALGFIALIWYLFNTRGAKGGFKALGWVLLYSTGAYIVLVVLLTVFIVLLKMAGIPISV